MWNEKIYKTIQNNYLVIDEIENEDQSWEDHLIDIFNAMKI